MRAIQSNPSLKFLPIRWDFIEKKSADITFLNFSSRTAFLRASPVNRDILKFHHRFLFSEIAISSRKQKSEKKEVAILKKKKTVVPASNQFPPFVDSLFHPEASWRKDRPWNGYKRSKLVAQTAFLFPTFREKIQLARAKPRDEVSPYDPILLHELILKRGAGIEG